MDPCGTELILYVRMELGSELAIKFLHYMVSTSWQCEEDGEWQQGTLWPHFFPLGVGRKVKADGTQLIKATTAVFTSIW